MMNRTKVLFILFSSLFFFVQLSAQQWTKALGLRGSAKEAISTIATDAAQNTYLGGTFDQEISLGNESFSSLGFDDVFLSKFDSDGEISWAISGGGSNFDQLSDLAIDQQGAVIWGGQFWIEGQFDDFTLPLVHDSRGIFLLKHSPDGDLIWGRSIEGKGLKILRAISTDQSDNIYLSGYFDNSLILEDTTLLAGSFQSMFLLKLDSAGQLLWARNVGYQGEIRPQALAPHPGGGVYVAGDFQGRAVFGPDSLRTFTEDRDVFLAAYDSSGMALWGQRAGDVYEDNCSAIATDDLGRVFLTGTFLGVMKLGDTFEIQTQGFNENFFLASYTPEGLPRLARSLGSTGDEAGRAILVREDRVFLTGHFYGDLRIDDLSVTGNENHFNGFLAAFDLDGNSQWLEAFRSSTYAEGNALAALNAERLLVAGNFSESASFGYLNLTGGSLNDIFLAQLNPFLPSAINTPLANRSAADQLALFPNPTTGFLAWQSDPDFDFSHWEVFNLQGQRVAGGNLAPREQSIDLQDFSAGIYFLHLWETGEFAIVKKIAIVD